MSIRRCFERARRFKYRGGHHIHSPFVFRLIEYAIEAQETTYRLEQLLNERTSQKSYYALLYRVVRYFAISKPIFIGAPLDVEVLFVESAIKTADRSKRTLFLVTEHCLIENIEKELPRLKKELNNETVVMVCNLFESEAARQIWEKLKKELPVRTSIDVMDFGILLFDKALHQQKYHLYARY